MPLEVPHNVPNFAYIIEHEEIGKLVFITDAMRFPYNIKGVHHLLIEANYSDDILIDNLCNGYSVRSHNENHLELEDTIDAIRRNISPNLRTLMLLHLSDSQSSVNGFQKRIFEEFGIVPIIADKGVIVELNKEDF